MCYWYYIHFVNLNHQSLILLTGIMYRDGQGVPQDYQKAMDYFLKSANQGYSNAQFSIGNTYFKFHVFTLIDYLNSGDVL